MTTSLQNKMIPHDVIAFAGNAHGGIVALKSLQQLFPAIEVLTSDDDVKALLRPADKSIHNIEESNTALVVCAGYHSIISKEQLSKKIFINTHPALLPKYRGMHGLAWAMLNFEPVLGFTIHLMNEYVDDGDILEQFSITYQEQTSQEIMAAFDDYVAHHLGRVVHAFVTGKLTPVKQNKQEATWVAKRNINDCIIDFNRDNKYINRLFKVLVRPYPLPMLMIRKRLYEVNGYQLLNRPYEMHNGRVVNIEADDVYIKTAEGLLIVNELIDFESREKIKASAILKMGQRLCR